MEIEADVVTQTASNDPQVGLRAVASLRALLEAVEELQVRNARILGWSWRQIAALLGVSKQAVHQTYGKDLSAPAGQAGVVSEALAAAGIPLERCGRARTAALAYAERQLYRWILERFVERGRPGGDELRGQAREFGLDPSESVAVFAREDLIHLDEEGEIAVAYPFSGRPTRHRVRLGGRGGHVWAMCAIDALGIAAMLGRAIEVHSSDPSRGDSVTVRVDARGRAEWEPAHAVVVAGSARSGPSYAGCCGVLNFFSSAASADGYLAERADVPGFPITITDAVAVGTAIFGEALAE